MVFLLAKGDILSVIHNETIVIQGNSSKELTILKNTESISTSPEGEGSTQSNEQVEDDAMCSEDESKIQENSDSPEADPKKVTKPDLRVVCCCLSTCGQLLAVADHAKHLVVWKRTPEDIWHILSTRQTARKCIKVCFTHCKEFLLAADRAGDVYSFPLSSPLEPGQLLLGHLSMLIDMVISRDDKFIITSDRDEKIRVSNFPNSYSIQSYCLGHTEFVSALCLCELNTDWLISGSGDGTLRIWDFKAGQELCVHNYMPDINCHLEGKDLETTKENTKAASCQRIPAVSAIQSATLHGGVAILFDKVACLGVYEVKAQETGATLELVQTIVYSCEPWDMAFDLSSQLLTLVPNQSQALNVYKLSETNVYSKFQMLPNIQEIIPYKQLIEHVTSQWDALKDCKKNDDLQHLYKHWYDNVEAYLEKKKNRQTEKLKKSKRFKKQENK